MTIGIALWTFISSVMTGSTDYLRSGKEMLFTYDLPWSIQILRKVFVESIVLAIHVLMAIPVVIIAQGEVSWINLVSLIGVLVNIVFGFGLALIISSYGIRYQDLGHALIFDHVISIPFYTGVLGRKRIKRSSKCYYPL